MFRAIFLASLILFALPLSASKIDLELKRAAKLYVNAVITASKSPEFLENFDDRQKLEEFATPKKAQKLFAWVKSWHEGNLYMDAKIMKQVCRPSTLLQKMSRSMICDEEWSYRYLKHVARGEIEEIDKPIYVYYTIEYKFSNIDRSWKIDETDVLVEKKQG